MDVIDLVTAASTYVQQQEQETPYVPRHTTENESFVAMIQRMIRALERRAVDDPALLPSVVELEKQLSQVANVVIATSAYKYSRDPFSSPSMLECGAMLKVGKSTISQRRGIGDRLIAERLEKKGVASFAAAHRERERQAREDARKLAAEAAPTWAEVRHLRAV